MKDSGIDFLDSIYLKYISSRNIKSNVLVRDSTLDDKYPFFTSGESVRTYKDYNVNGENLFIATGGFANIKYYNREASYSTDVLSLKISNNYITKFIYYVLISEKENMNKLMFKGQGLKHLDIYEFGKIFIPNISLDEQKKIADYLDDKTDQIDSLIENIKKKIELLEELRSALINQVVTKGLDPNVEIKDSGIDWIGEIPKHWRISKIKYLSSIISKGTTPSTIGEQLIDSVDVRYLKSENIVDWNLNKEPQFYIYKETNELIKRSKLKNHDVLVVIAGAMIGKTAIMKKDFLPANTNQAVSFIRPLETNYSNLIYFWMQANYMKILIKEQSVVSAQPNLSMENLGNFYITLPQLEEQKKIADYLYDKTEKTDSIIKNHQKKIELLEEQRSALISNVVTGKIRVS